MTSLEHYREARTTLEKGRVQVASDMFKPRWALNHLDDVLTHEWNHVSFVSNVSVEDVVNHLADLYKTVRAYVAIRLNTTVSELNERCERLFLRKNSDYGDAYAQLGPVGVVMSLYHKFRRLDNLSSRAAQVVSEGVEDTMVDSLNYCILTVLSFSR